MNLILFDIDGTLTPSGSVIQNDMVNKIKELAQNNSYVLGLVGGGTMEKISLQMGEAIFYFKYIFAECGSTIYIDQKLVFCKNMIHCCDRIILNDMIKSALASIAEMPIIYHGHQIDFRNGLVYVSPPGMQASDYERNIFMDNDKKYDLRKKLLNNLKLLNVNNSFEIVLGGNVGIAIYPKGWNKAQVIDYLTTNISESFTKIYYFGDRTEFDGNDYPIYSHPLVNGSTVKNYCDTINLINKLFLSNK